MISSCSGDNSFTKTGRNLDWGVWPGDEVIICSLHTDVVHEAFAGHLVVRSQDVVKVADCVLEIA